MADPTRTSRPARRAIGGRAGGGRAFGIGLTVVALVAFGVRLLTLSTVAKRNPDGGDPLYYHLQANFLVHGHGFADPFVWKDTGHYVPSAVHPPLYTLWLAIASVFGAQGFGAHKVMSCLAGTATVALIGLAAREIAGWRAGLIAAAIAALYPPLWIIDGILMPEGLFTATIALTILAAYRWLRKPTLGWAGLLGGAIALAALTRGEAIMLLPLLALPLTLLRRRVPMRRRVRSAGIAVVVFGVLVAPWMIRNAATFKAFVPFSTNGNEVLVYANNPFAYGTAHQAYTCRDGIGPPANVSLAPTGNTFIGFWYYPWEEYLRCRQGEPPGDASQKAKYWQQKGIDYAKAHPGQLATVAAARVGRIWDVYAPWQNTFFSQIEGRKLWVSHLGLWCYWALLPLAAVGLVVLRRRRTPIFPLVIQAAVVTLTALYAYGIERFRTPLDVAVLIAAGVALDAGLRRLWPGTRRPRVPPARIPVPAEAVRG